MNKYIFYWFKNISLKIIANGIGATVQGVKLDFIKSLQILRPSLFEQRIITILDEAFEGIDKAVIYIEINLKA